MSQKCGLNIGCLLVFFDLLAGSFFLSCRCFFSCCFLDRIFFCRGLFRLWFLLWWVCLGCRLSLWFCCLVCGVLHLLRCLLIDRFLVFCFNRLRIFALLGFLITGSIFRFLRFLLSFFFLSLRWLLWLGVLRCLIRLFWCLGFCRLVRLGRRRISRFLSFLCLFVFCPGPHW